jgi:hypothetical protein
MKRGESHRRRRGAGHFLLLGLLLCGTLASASEAPLDRIAFGSCNRSDQAQPIWPAVLQLRPQLWIWSGDIIYADTEEMDSMAKLYRQQKSQPDYQKLLACCQVIGTWDDHDYGRNDGDRSYRQKVESQRLLLDFLDEPANTPRRRQAGIYASHLQGPPGQRVKVILLDTRFSASHPGGWLTSSAPNSGSGWRGNSTPAAPSCSLWSPAFRSFRSNTVTRSGPTTPPPAPACCNCWPTPGSPRWFCSAVTATSPRSCDSISTDCPTRCSKSLRAG